MSSTTIPASSDQTLQKPTSSRPSSTSAPRLASSNSAMFKAPLTTHSTATVSETASFQGTYPVSIGAATIIHPRAKFLSFEGPISVGEGCIVGEKSVIGGPQTSSSSATAPSTESSGGTSPPSIATVLEDSILIAPLAVVSAGTHIQSAATIDTFAHLGKCVRIGEHAKVCSSCCIPDQGAVDDWVVIWGGGAGCDGGATFQRRKRAHGRQSRDGGMLGGRIVEDGRLLVLNREREGLTKLIGAGGGAAKRR